MPDDKKKTTYDASQITVLEGLDPVRKRPGMYIGGTGPEGLHHLIWEVFDNSLDEAMAGYCDRIEVTLLPDGSARITDNGRGIPVDKQRQTGKSALETVLTILHAGGKFGDGGYKVSGGLHGVGVSVVNALSTKLRAEVKRDGKLYAQEYEKGKPLSDIKVVGTAEGTGTIITFSPDPEIFKNIRFSFKTIVDHLRQQAYLTKKVWITITDERIGVTDSAEEDFDDQIESEEEITETDVVGEKIEEDDIDNKESRPIQPKEPSLKPKIYNFYFEGGIKSYVVSLSKNRQPINEKPFYYEKIIDDVQTTIAVVYTDDFKEHVYSFANNIHTTDGGTHLTGFRSALTRVINDYAKKNGWIKSASEALSGDDVREGLTAVISVKLREPQFEGQTKAKLGNAEVRSIAETATAEGFAYYLEENPQEGRRIVEKCSLSAKARLAARAARETIIRKGALEGMTLPGKLADCSSKDPSRSEIYIVEGDSAGGCFSGDAKVALTDGRNLSFKQLIEEDKKGKQNYCYTIKQGGKIGIEKITNPRLTHKKASVIKLVLDNGEEIVCTPDHKFMLRDSSFIQAKDLKTDSSLMSFDIDITSSNISEIDHSNLKLVRIESLKTNIDVYDIEVPSTHNFALASGVFVHNSAKSARDRNFQAILPLRGKILNVERARLDRMLSSDEIKALIVAVGVGIGDQIDYKKLRYHRIIIMTDADVDGAHIRTLLLTFFYRNFPDIVENGHIYIAQPPLYIISHGKEKVPCYNDQEKDDYLKKIGFEPEEIQSEVQESESPEEIVDEETEETEGDTEKDNDPKSDKKKPGKISIQRYKGLGEMNPEQLWQTTMNPANRVLLQVTVEEAEKADEIFTMLMGDEVPPRKRFIQTHAKAVKNLDV